MKYKLSAELVRWLPFAILAVVVILCILLVRQQTSPLVRVTQWVSDKLEGFQSGIPTTSPTCPAATYNSNGTLITPAYTFFTDAMGESLCCSGTVDSVTHTCTPGSSRTPIASLCAFRPGVPNPRDPSNSLPLCSGVVDAVTQNNSKSICPPSLPKYASDNTVNPVKQTCCATATNIDGTECISKDLQAGNFCRVNPAAGEKKCSTLLNFESVTCPPNLQKINYTMGPKETAVYSKAEGVSAPLCFGIQNSCFPDDTVKQLQSQGVFTSQPADPTKWGYACSGYTKYYVKKDQSDPAFRTSYVE